MCKQFMQTAEQTGYIALVSTIIISAVLLIMTIEAGQSGWYTRLMVLGTEAKVQSRILAEGCSQQALAQIVSDGTWLGDATTSHQIGTCYVFPIQKNYPNSENVTLRIQATVRNSMTNIVTVYNMHDIHQNVSAKDLPLPQHTSLPDLIPTLVSVTEVPNLP
jgi:hypothetical protein